MRASQIGSRWRARERAVTFSRLRKSWHLVAVPTATVAAYVGRLLTPRWICCFLISPKEA